MSPGKPDKRVSSFVKLTRPYHERLFRIAISLCHDRDQAADLTQEALIRAFNAFDRFRPGAPVLPWLARILRNVHLDSFKTGRAQHELAEHQIAPEKGGVYDGVQASAPDPLASLERARMAAWLQEEVAALDEPQRIVITLRDIEELSYQEVAEIAGVPVGTVRSRLARARAHLRGRLQQRMAREEDGSTKAERGREPLGHAGRSVDGAAKSGFSREQKS